MRKICVVTGTRAEFGLLQGLMRKIQQNSALSLQLVVTGMHLVPEFGMTATEIEKAGFSADAQVDMLLANDSAAAIAKSIGLGLIGFADAFAKLQPDILVVLGDRFELLAPVQAALPARIPVAHIHGGESTEGAIDEAIRHAISKMSHLHFVAAEPYRLRLIRMGEMPARVFNFGAPGLDQLRQAQLPDRTTWQQETGFSLGKVNFLVTYHPATCESHSPLDGLREVLSALDHFTHAHIILTRANADSGGRAINQRLETFAASQQGRIVLFDNLGSRLYLGLLRLVDVVIGNSSSGLIEAPFFGVPTVNVGSRQDGRLRAESVFDCAEKAAAIQAAIQQALDSPYGIDGLPVTSPYGQGNAAEKMVAVLATVDLDGLVKKKFYDGP